MTRPVRALVVGAGPAAVEMHLPVLARLRDRGEVELSIVCDLVAGRAAEARRRFGFLNETGDAATAMARSDIDAVYVFGNAQLHYECGARALRSRKHLFVEKPISPTYEQARELARVASEHALIAAGGHNRRFNASLVAVRARAGTAGWRFAEAVFHKPEFGKSPRFGARTWLGANGIHGLDALLFMMGGLPDHVHAFVGEAGADAPGAFSAVMRWSDGAQGAFLCNNSAGTRREEYAFHGPGETCNVSETGLTVYKDNQVVESAASASRQEWFADTIAAEHDDFLAAIRTGENPRHSIEAVMPSLFLAELIERGYSGRVALPEPAPWAAPRPDPPTSILIVKPANLQGALTALLPRYKLVSLDDVQAMKEPRPDVVAAILGSGAPPLTSDLLAKLPALAVVGVAALSLSRYDPETLIARGIALVNASDAYAESVAEFALGLAILGRRKAFASHEVMRRGGWGADLRMAGMRGRVRGAARALRPAIAAAGLESALRRAWAAAGKLAEPASPGVSRNLQGATAGLVGWGANARAFTRRLLAAKVRVLVFSNRAAPAEVLEAGALPASLSEVLAADLVSLHRGLTPETRHCLGASELAKLRPGAVLINVARGPLIEPNALVRRLKRGDIVACLDTFEHEPLAASHPLRRLPNVFLTSHIAGGSLDTQMGAAEEVVRKVAAYLEQHDAPAISAERLRAMT